MSKGGGASVTQTVDPQTQAYVDQMRRTGLGYAGIPGTQPQLPSGTPNLFRGVLGSSPAYAPLQPFAPPPNPAVDAAVSQYAKYAQGGLTGFGALSGDPTAAAQFMNPYLSQMDPFFARQRAQAVGNANDQATLGGAFGGDRSGIAAAQAGNLADQTQAGFNYQGFNDAMQRAQQAAQLGFGAIGAGTFLPQQYASGQLGLLQQALGPYGTMQTQQTQNDPFSQLLGLGLMAFGPGGPLAKAALGSVAGYGGWNPNTPV